MDQNEKTLKDDIERAERNILIFGLLGIFSAIGVIVYTLMGL